MYNPILQGPGFTPGKSGPCRSYGPRPLILYGLPTAAIVTRLPLYAQRGMKKADVDVPRSLCWLLASVCWLAGVHSGTLSGYPFLDLSFKLHLSRCGVQLYT